MTTRQKQARFLTELLCQNYSKRANIALPAKFWELPEWKKYYKFQIVFVNKYLNNYSFDILVTFIKKKNIFTLAPKWIPEALLKFSPPQKDIIHVDVEIIYGSLGNSNKEKDLGFLD